MRTVIRRQVDVAATAQVVWEYVTDWPTQEEWIPKTRVERIDSADSVGGRLRAWTGIGPLGFWDPMTITSWDVRPDGGGRCEVLHTGNVVRGEGEFEVLALSDGMSRFVWSELLILPLGRLGALGWKLMGPVLTRMVDGALRDMKARVQHIDQQIDRQIDRRLDA
jgi:Polyketide cyclase / dehydrase and lipid transport